MTAHVDVHPDRLATFCQRRRVAELALFGSVIRDDFGPESDADVLVPFDPKLNNLPAIFDRTGT